MKKYLKIVFIGLLTSSIFLACTNENDILDNKNAGKFAEKSFVNRGTNCSYINDANPSIVTLTPTTLANLCAAKAQAVVNAGTSATYKFIIDDVETNGQWSVYSGSGITFNNSSSTATGSLVTVNFSANFVSGSIQVIGTDATGQVLGPILRISKSGGGNCECPNPVIRCVLAGPVPATNNNFWRFQLDNLQAGDTFVWSQLHAPIMSGTNGSSIVANPQGPLYSGFTIYCEVSRRCSNGIVLKRKAYYTNYYGGNLQSGTQGFVGSCTTGGTTGGGELDPELY